MPMITVLSALALAAAPLPQGERLPPPDFGDKAIAATVDALLATLETGDALQVSDEAQLTLENANDAEVIVFELAL